VSAPIACASTTTATPSRSSPSSTGQRHTAERRRPTEGVMCHP
jgi:hypothetical protein